MASKSFSFPRAISLCALVAGLVALTAVAQVLDRTVDTENQINRSAAQTQQQINQVADQTQNIVTEYRSVLGETENLRIYNDQLQRIVSNQEREVGEIATQLETLEDTERDVVPLLIDMAEMVGRLVEADMPFRIEERRAVALNLVDLLDRSDVTISEKYRRVLEAYQNEIEFGRTTESYRGQLPGGTQVDFLRIGRTLLFYQSLDGNIAGWYNPTARQYEELPDRYRQSLRDGLAIAQNQVAPDLVRLPVPAPERAQ